MKRLLSTGLLSACVTAACLTAAPAICAADELVLARNAAQKFATLPAGVRFPEGITANPANGDVYVATFDYIGPNPNKLLRLSANGTVIGQRDFGGAPMLGLAFDASANRVYIANFGVSKIQRVAADLQGTITDVATIPGIGAPTPRSVDNPDGSQDTIQFGSSFFPVPNAMTFDSQGNLYVSDSFQGAIWRIDSAANCAPCLPTLVKQDPLLATAGYPPFGANGIAFDGDESHLFIANTGDDRILRMDMASGEVTVFAESVNGADGIAFDSRGRLWVAANQADEVVALNGQGRVIARLGEFQGINRDGTPDGLLFPASLVIVGDHMFVTNLALPLNSVPGDEPEEDVLRFTVSRIKLPNR
jgi:DNA-binding beta-propeller fold protein YncE